MITDRGAGLLESELAALLVEREQAATSTDLQHRDQLDEIDERIAHIRHTLQTAQRVSLSVDDIGDTVIFGCSVTLRSVDTGDTRCVHIVGDDEANLVTGHLSHRSPMALTLLGRRIGDVVTVGGTHDVRRQASQIVQITVAPSTPDA